MNFTLLNTICDIPMHSILLLNVSAQGPSEYVELLILKQKVIAFNICALIYQSIDMLSIFEQ